MRRPARGAIENGVGVAGSGPELPPMRSRAARAFFLVLILAATAVAEPVNIDAIVKGIESSDPVSRSAAVEKASEVIYSLEDDQDTSRLSTALLKLLLEDSDFEPRWQLASVFQNYLTRGASAELLEAAFPLLKSEEEDVRRYLWMGFGQQSVQPHLTPELQQKVFALLDHPKPEIALEAMNWCIQASQSRNFVVGEAPDEVAQRAQKEFKETVDQSESGYGQSLGLWDT